jgi:hypothetical protein
LKSRDLSPFSDAKVPGTLQTEDRSALFKERGDE